jgi:hypothetical protein
MSVVTVETTPAGHNAGWDSRAQGSDGVPLPFSAGRLVRAIEAGDFAMAALVITRCATLTARLEPETDRLVLVAGGVDILHMRPVPDGAGELADDPRALALRAMNVFLAADLASRRVEMEG